MDLLQARESLHKFIDPMWESGLVSRPYLYALMSDLLGREAHISQMSLEELHKCADFFVDYYKAAYPCHRCNNFVTNRHFLPVCAKGKKRDHTVCDRFQERK